MSTIKIEGAIRASKWKFDSEFQLIFTPNPDPEAKTYADSREPIYIYIAPYTIEIEIDDGVMQNFHQLELKSLQRQRKIILAENEKRLNQIDQQIAEHQSIEHKTGEAA